VEGVRGLTQPLDYEPRPEPAWRKHFSGESLFHVILAVAAVIVMVIYAATGIHPVKIVLGLILAVVASILAPFLAVAVADEFRVLFMSRPKRLHRLRVRAFHPRRYREWTVERDGRPIALLMRPEWEDMFWVSYRIRPLTTDGDLRARLFTDDFWNNADDLVYRSRESGWVHPYTFPGGKLRRDEGGASLDAMPRERSPAANASGALGAAPLTSEAESARRAGREETGRPFPDLPVESTDASDLGHPT
jgi:hypothetical protein